MDDGAARSRLNSSPDRSALRLTFDQAAELYNRARPGYPGRAFDEIASFGELGAGARVLEIGPGTGQATVELARRGYRVTAVELGKGLAKIARRNLAAYPNVDITVADFEGWPQPAEPFDAVVAATAFHWLDPDTRVAKAAAALRPGGMLALMDTDHVAGGTEQFWIDVQDCYEQWDPTTEPDLRLPPASAIDDRADELAASGLFEEVVVHQFETDLMYTTREYLDVLLTYSGHIALPATARDGLLDCIGKLIDGRYDGQIVKRYLTTLRLARRWRAEWDSNPRHED